MPPSFSPVNHAEFLRLVNMFRVDTRAGVRSILSELLFRTQRNQGYFDGTPLERGQAAFGVHRLADQCGVSPKAVRSVLDRLKKCSEVVVNGTSEGTILSWCNYEELSGLRGEREDERRASEGRAKGERRATSQTLDVKTLDVNSTTLAPPSNAAAAPPAEVSVLTYLTYPCNGTPDSWDLSTDQIDQWRILYPGLDIEAECRKAMAWILAATNRRKTAGGMTRFLVGWLSRSNDRPAAPGRNGQHQTTEPTPPYLRFKEQHGS